MRVWDQSGAYLGDFLARAGADWHHSEWDFRNVIAAGPAKCIWTYNSPAIASTNRSLARSAHCGSSPSTTDAGPWRRGRASRIDLQDRFRCRRRETMQVKTDDRIYLDARAKAGNPLMML